MPSRNRQIFAKLRENGVLVPDINEAPTEERQRPRRSRSPGRFDDAASASSVYTPSETGVMNPLFLQNLTPSEKCDAYVRGVSLQDMATPPKQTDTSLVPYSPSSPSTVITQTSLGNAIDKPSTSIENAASRSKILFNAPRTLRIGLPKVDRQRKVNNKENSLKTFENCKEISQKRPVRRQLIAPEQPSNPKMPLKTSSDDNSQITPVDPVVEPILSGPEKKTKTSHESTNGSFVPHSTPRKSTSSTIFEKDHRSSESNKRDVTRRKESAAAQQTTSLSKLGDNDKDNDQDDDEMHYGNIASNDDDNQDSLLIITEDDNGRSIPIANNKGNSLKTIEDGNCKESSQKRPVKRQLIAPEQPSPIHNKMPPKTSDDKAQTTPGNSECNLSPYQLLRLRNLKQNENYLQDLGVTVDPVVEPQPTLSSPKKKKLKTLHKRADANSTPDSTPCESKTIIMKKKHSSMPNKRDVPRRKASAAAQQTIKTSSLNRLDSDSDEDDNDESDNDKDDDEINYDNLDSNDDDDKDSLSISSDDEPKSSSSDMETEKSGRGETKKKPVLHPTPKATDQDTQESTYNLHTLSDEEIDDDLRSDEGQQDNEHGGHEENTASDNEGAPDPTDPKALSAPGSKINKTKQKAKRKELRNLGKKYTTKDGRIIKAKLRKRPHQCSLRKCHLIVTPTVGEELYNEYWQLGSHDKQVAYLAARIESKEVERKRPRTHNTNREKNLSHKYFFEIEGERHRVCRSTIKNTLGVTCRFIRDVSDNKMKSISGITTDDRRGKKTPVHALKPEKKEAVKQHIASFPAYVSHYCRSKTKDQRYLASDLTEAQMYRLYCSATPEEERVSASTYHKVFKSTGLKFHPPQTDGCDTCDTLDTSIKNSGEEERKNFEKEKEIHQRKAEKAYDLKKAAKAEAKQNPSSRVLVADLQQCLPTPHLKCKKIYYSRQLYVLNFTVYDCSTGLTHCYMWSEVEGNRGSNEVATCLLQHFLKHVPETVTKITIFTDCCAGQNRNSTVAMMMFIALQEHPSLQEINHIFLVPGHTFMPEVDGKHAIIEKYKNKLAKVNVPEEWYTAVEEAGKTDLKNFPEGKFKVTHVSKFYDVAALAKDELIRRNKCIDKDPFNYTETHWWKYERKNIGLVRVKSSFNENAEFRTLSFLRRGVRSDRVMQLLPCLKTLPGETPISKEKKNDLINLLPYLDPEYHDFYINLPAAGSICDLHPLSPIQEEEENTVIEGEIE